MATNGGMYLSAPTPIAGTVYLFHGEATVVASPNESGCITSPSFLSEINLNASMEI